MVVRTNGCGREVSGLYIGPRNARRYFPRSSRHIELQLGHLHIHCDLAPEFWKDRPEIRDARLADWLFSRIFHGKAHRAPAPVAMIRAGDGLYRVQPIAMPPASLNATTRVASIPPKRSLGDAGAD